MASYVPDVLLKTILAVFLLCIGYFRLQTKFARVDRSRSSDKKEAPGVSILRPMKGLDTEFEKCIESAFQQEYPNFEILLCVENPNDPAIPVAKRIIERHRNVDSTLIIGAERYGVNPKVNNLTKAYENAKYNIVWILDSNCWVSSGTLGRAVDILETQPNIHLVHNLPLCVDISGAWGSRLDEMYLSTSHAKFYVAINAVAIAPCIMGKSNFFRRSQLNAVEPGGIKEFSKYIAEDHMIGDRLWKAGGRHAMTSDAVIQPVADNSFSDYFFRRMRWQRVRKYMVVAATMIEPLTECFTCGLLGAAAFSYFLGVKFWLFYLCHIILWCGLDFWNFIGLHKFRNVEVNSETPFFAIPQNYDNAVAFKKWIQTWIVRELMALPIWIKAMSGRKIDWRNRLFYIKSDNTAVEISRSL
ncbi:glycosyl transferase family 21-domain-containing protein [Dipodascopsis uninucleata]